MDVALGVIGRIILPREGLALAAVMLAQAVIQGHGIGPRFPRSHGDVSGGDEASPKKRVRNSGRGREPRMLRPC